LVGERGYKGLTVRELSRLAGVSTRAFYEGFDNVEDCFAQAYREIIDRALTSAVETPSRPDETLRDRLPVFFATLLEDPRAAGLVLVHAPTAGPTVRARTRGADRALERFLENELACIGDHELTRSAVVRAAVPAAFQLARTRLLPVSRQSPVKSTVEEFADWLLTFRRVSLGRTFTNGPMQPTFDPGSSERVIGIADDRLFLLAAVTRLAAREGYLKLTVPAIRREAGISRRRFDEHFVGVNDCFLAAVERRLKLAAERAASVGSWNERWDLSVADAVRGFCIEVMQDKGLARLAFVDLLAAGAQGLELQDRGLKGLARRFRQMVPRPLRPSEVSAEASVAAAHAIIAAEIEDARLGRIGRVVPRAVFLLLAPAMGAERAEQLICAG